MRRLGFGLALLLAAPAAFAGEPVVERVEVVQEATGTWRFDVTVLHNDEDWDHYADKWVVLTPEGQVLGERVLLHPHEDEQPFTRSLGGVAIPPGIDEVTVRAEDSLHGPGPTFVVRLGQ